MSTRKRKWTNPDGKQKQAWVVDYVDNNKKRHLKTFAKKRDAVRWNKANTPIIEETLANDLLWGAKAIGDYIGISDRMVYYLAERKLLPVMYIGSKIVSSKRRLCAYFEQGK